ncbi:sentrin-specific protease 1-like [Olea europaea subsp. europaea]|uniref:Sentrin-specific protease 1-like n=1 Tax=Olea europaea subsp. europaea TaxID=158383 RepID=A0A8S0VDT7_OLEEU|nr:sentrin-specific protease 1-like [Olea europaea subsp. europaea]
MSIFNSARQTYPNLRVRADVEAFVRVIPHLMRVIGLWTKDLDNHEGDSMELKIVLDYDVPQQQNNHDCGIFVIKYAEYILHNGFESMPKEFDATRARLDIATQLYIHRDIKKATKGGTKRSRGV